MEIAFDDGKATVTLPPGINYDRRWLLSLIVKKLYAKVGSLSKMDAPGWLAQDLTFTKYVELMKLNYKDTKEKIEKIEVSIDAGERQEQTNLKKISLSLSNLIADPVWVVDEKGTCLAVNQAICQVLASASRNWLEKTQWI